MYFVIHNSEDGEASVHQMGAEELQNKLKADYWGTGKRFLSSDDTFSCDPNYWGGKLLIIKGEIIVPKPKQTVTEYEV
jgi:hypothetical protein